MFRDFVKARISNAWQISETIGGQAASIAQIPLQAVMQVSPPAIRSVLASAESTAGSLYKTTMRVGEDLQRRATDMLFDAVEMRPVTNAMAEAGIAPRARPGLGQLQPELEYLKAVNGTGPSDNSLIVIVLAVTYSSLRRADEGIAQFEKYLDQYKTATPGQRAVYLACLALLRAASAQSASAWDLPETLNGIRLLKVEVGEAIRLTEQLPDFDPSMQKLFPRWVAGLLLTNLPVPFADHTAAEGYLTWCVKILTANSQVYLAAGQFLHEAYFSLAVIYRDCGNKEKAEAYLKLTGFGWDRPPIQIATPFAVTPRGLRDSAKHITEHVPGQVFSAGGFEISDMHFIVSDDGSELIGVDAASSVVNCKEAYDYFVAHFQARFPGRTVPLLTKVMITHFHWDHAGGLDFYRGLNPDLKVWASAHFEEEAPRARHQPPPYQWFMGEEFVLEAVRHFHPDNTVAAETTVTAGGTEIRLIALPKGGGETPDGMFVYLPGNGVLFTGDIMVPWVGSPYVAEGDPDALLETLKFTGTIQPEPKIIVHGHGAIGTFYPTLPAMLRMQAPLGWLKDEVVRRIRANENRAQIAGQPLVPPVLLEPAQSDLRFPYMIMREPFLSRVYVKHVGYWGAGLENVV